MRREKSKWVAPMRTRVPRRGTGAGQLVVSKGAALFSSGLGSTGPRVRSLIGPSTGFGRNPVDRAKPFDIPKREVWEAYKRVRANQGAAGVDGQSIADFEADLSNNLYKIWNRMSSGSYFSPPVRRGGQTQRGTPGKPTP